MINGCINVKNQIKIDLIKVLVFGLEALTHEAVSPMLDIYNTLVGIFMC